MYAVVSIYSTQQVFPVRINNILDSHDDVALGFTPGALPDATLTIYPGLGPALLNTNLCFLVEKTIF